MEVEVREWMKESLTVRRLVRGCHYYYYYYYYYKASTFRFIISYVKQELNEKLLNNVK
jgi:hypothetical protein